MMLMETKRKAMVLRTFSTCELNSPSLSLGFYLSYLTLSLMLQNLAYEESSGFAIII